MADTKTVRYGDNGQYQIEVAEKDAEQFAVEHAGYIEGSENDPNRVVEAEREPEDANLYDLRSEEEKREGDSRFDLRTEEEKQRAPHATEHSGSPVGEPDSTPLFSETRQANDPFKGQAIQ